MKISADITTGEIPYLGFMMDMGIVQHDIDILPLCD